MSDDQGSTTGDDAPDPMSVPPAIPAEPIDAIGAFSAPARRRPAAYAAVVIGLLGLVGGAIFFARSVTDKAATGAKTPELAVQRLFNALENEDAIGVLESLAPAERDALSGRVQAITRELSRLGILSKDLDLGKIPGVDLAFTNLKFSTESLAPGFSSVKLTQGRSTYRIDPASSPLGDYLRGVLPRSAAKAVTGSDDLADEDIHFTTIQNDGSWYVSLWYSIAEDARRSAGAPVPHFGSGIPARGAQTPEAAVEQFFRAGALLDVRRLIELMPPDEAAALHDYAPLFIDAVENGAIEARRAFRFTLRSLELSHRTSGGESIVKIDKISFRFSLVDSGVFLEYDGDCATFNGGDFFGGGKPQHLCGKGLLPAAGVPGVPSTLDSGFVTVRRGGVWYLSPTRTLLDGFIASLKGLNRSDLESFKQFFGAFMGMGGSQTFQVPAGVPTPRT